MIAALRKELEPVFSRETAAKKTSALSPAGFANADSGGFGPGGVRCGKKVLYEKEQFLQWFEARMIASAAKAKPALPKARKARRAKAEGESHA